MFAEHSLKTPALPSNWLIIVRQLGEVETLPRVGGNPPRNEGRR
jgi:hypothetical protein